MVLELISVELDDGVLVINLLGMLLHLQSTQIYQHILNIISSVFWSKLGHTPPSHHVLRKIIK